MARKTLLSLVNSILSATNEEAVNSIYETVSAEQVVDILEGTYESFVITQDIPELRRLIHLESYSDLARPCMLYVKDNSSKIEWVRYDGREIMYMEPEQFLIHVSETYGPSGVTQNISANMSLPYGTERDPQYYTSFDDETIVFDSFRKRKPDEAFGVAEDTLTSTKSLVFGQVVPAFVRDDNFVIPFDNELTYVMLEDAKSMAILQLNKEVNAKVEKRSRVGKAKWQQQRYKTNDAMRVRRPNYARQR